MSTSLIVTVLGPDRLGIVELLSRTVSENGGNWLASRMAHLAGKFAGVIEVSVREEHLPSLTEALSALSSHGLAIVVESSDQASEVEGPVVQLELVGQDRPGILREMSRVLAERSVNVEELETDCSSAAMSGELLFHARASLRLPEETDLAELQTALEQLANDLMVEISLDREPD